MESKTECRDETSRGFVAPKDLAERTLHKDDIYITVKISRHELRQLSPSRHGVVGRFAALKDNRNEVYEIIRYADA